MIQRVTKLPLPAQALQTGLRKRTPILSLISMVPPLSVPGKLWCVAPSRGNLVWGLRRVFNDSGCTTRLPHKLWKLCLRPGMTSIKGQEEMRQIGSALNWSSPSYPSARKAGFTCGEVCVLVSGV